MRLLYLTPGFPPFTGGGERYVEALARTLAGQGHSVTIVTSAARSEKDFWQAAGQPAGPQVERAGPLTVIRCPLRPLPWPLPGPAPGGHPHLLAWRLAMVLLSHLPGDQTRLLLPLARQIPPIADLDRVLGGLPPRFDLVHAFNLSWEQILAAGHSFAARQRLPYAITPFAHFGEAAGRGDWHGRQVARNSTMDHQRWLLEGADAVLTLTGAEAEGFAAWGIRPARIVVAGGGLDPAEAAGPPAEVLARYGLRGPYALFVGRLNYDKGALHAVAALRRLRQRGSPLSLVLAGRQTEAFRAAYARLPVAEQAAIRPLGVVAEADKQALLRGAAMLLLPSRIDSFGIVLLEAWAQGTPVIGARAGGIPHVIAEGEDGLLVPFGDAGALAEAMARLLADPALRRRLGERGRAKVRRDYTWERVGERVLACYRELVAGKG